MYINRVLLLKTYSQIEKSILICNTNCVFYYLVLQIAQFLKEYINQD